jgi:diaminopimelate epimerase
MTTIPFVKYQGAGNDFIMVDNRQHVFARPYGNALIRRMCDRRFGIGADGLILLQHCSGFDFEMVYFNADGFEGSMCGNGGRCTVAFARQLGMMENTCRFKAVDGPHDALIRRDAWVELKMQEVGQVETGEDYFVLDTGSPHYVIFVEDLNDINVVEAGKVIRYSDRFRTAGINVNFVETTADGLRVFTYERGVEDETLSCGTGVTACAIANALKNRYLGNIVTPIQTKGGNLEVRFQQKKEGDFQQVWLCGPTERIFEGVYFVQP